jgi:tRNA pseudouridine13 synthase
VTPEPGGTQATRCFTAPRDLPHGFPPAPARGHIKRQPDDFRVEEILGFEPDGEGPHAWLWIRKRDATTQWLAGALARLAGVRRRDVGYAGLKDRAAVTSQWFSVPVEGRAEPDWGALDSPQVEVLEVTRHRKKLRRGVQAGNRFRICVQGFEGDRDALASRAAELGERGVPNYFGAQRFGRDARNVVRAWEMLGEGRRIRDRDARGIYLSAARAMLFNRVLARRVADGSWWRALPGEALMLDGSRSVFSAAEPDADIEARLARMDVHPTGPLWGSGDPIACGEALVLETSALAECAAWRDGLAAAGLVHARRALRVSLAALEVAFEAPDRLLLAFALPAGAYATMAVRELVDTDSV